MSFSSHIACRDFLLEDPENVLARRGMTLTFNAMLQAALWAVIRVYGIPDVDLLVSLYEHSKVRMAPNDQQCLTITFTGVAQGSALSPLFFLSFMNMLLALVTVRGRRSHISHGLNCEVQSHRQEHWAADPGKYVGQFNLIGFVDDLSLFTLSGRRTSVIKCDPGV